MALKRDNIRLYRIWLGMRARCNNENNKDYHRYGGRGISVCDEWNKSFLSFMNWAKSNGYSDALTIDRISVDGDYCSQNCRWATATQQQRNKRVQKNNKLNESGIHMDRGKFRAVIYVNNKRIDLGRHSTLEEAKRARKNGEKLYWEVVS